MHRIGTLSVVTCGSTWISYNAKKDKTKMTTDFCTLSYCSLIVQIIGAKKSGFEGAAQFGAVDREKPGYAAQFM
jgi:hypothetical protein